MHLTTLAFAIILSGSPGPISWPEALSKPLLAKVEPFVWPKPKTFDAQWAESLKHDAAKTLLQLPIDGKARWYLVSPSGGTYGAFRLDRLVGRDTRFTDSVSGQTIKLRAYGGEKESEVEVLERLESKVSHDALMPRTYVTTLLESNGPLYTSTAEGDERLRALVDSFESAPEAERLAKITQWAKDNRSDDGLFERFRDYRPMGSCSMDTTPQSTARVFAELAFARGDLGRFLQLQIAIMGDNFERTAWSSYGEASHRTEAERLTSTGIDVDQFLLGLAVSTQANGANLGAWRLARAIQESGRGSSMLPKLEALASSPTLDAYNRLIATQVWFFVQAREEQTFRPDEKARAAMETRRKELIARALKLPLHPIAREWLQEP